MLEEFASELLKVIDGLRQLLDARRQVTAVLSADGVQAVAALVAVALRENVDSIPEPAVRQSVANQLLLLAFDVERVAERDGVVLNEAFLAARLYLQRVVGT